MKKDSDSSSSQSGSDKKEADNGKQFNLQGIAEKERTLVQRDEVIKDFARQADTAKTVKTYEIIKEIKSFIEQGNKSSMTLKVLPENMGDVKVSLDMVKNMVQARIDVDNDNVRQFVQNNLDTLKQSLAQSGVNISMLQVNVSSSDQKQQKFVQPGKRKPASGKEFSYEEGSETDSAKKILGYNSYDYLV